MSVQSVIDAHDSEVSRSVDQLQTRLDSIIRKIEVGLIAMLTANLAVKSGRVVPTAGNVRLIESLPTLFEQQLQDAGFDAALASFLTDFNDQFDYFDELLRASGVKTPVEFTAADRDFFTARKAAVALVLSDLAYQGAQRARFQGLLSISGDTPVDLSAAVSKSIGTVVPAIVRQAQTDIFTFYRSVADRGYAIVQKSEPQALRYVYAGPPATDPLIRVFCKRLMAQVVESRTWTRAEIDAMDNGQLPNVFVTCGGYNCRHQWRLALEKEIRRLADHIRNGIRQ
jgi:hypothetical protein